MLIWSLLVEYIFLEASFALNINPMYKKYLNKEKLNINKKEKGCGLFFLPLPIAGLLYNCVHEEMKVDRKILKKLYDEFDDCLMMSVVR